MFLFNDNGDWREAATRQLHRAEDWDEPLAPEVECQQAERKHENNFAWGGEGRA